MYACMLYLACSLAPSSEMDVTESCGDASRLQLQKEHFGPSANRVITFLSTRPK